jgi:hypothetical protein
LKKEGLIKMENKHKGSILKEARELMKDKELSKALSGLIEKKRGALGFLLGILKKRPSTFNPFVLKGLSLYQEPSGGGCEYGRDYGYPIDFRVD